MKVLKLIGLLFMVVVCASCEKPAPDPIYTRYLCLSFRDVSGNDLVNGIGFEVWRDGGYVTGGEDDTGGIIKPELYTLFFICEDKNANRLNYMSPNPIMALQKSGSIEVPHPYMNNYDYLTFDIITEKSKPFVEKITLKLKCSYLFGDNEVHDIVTWWERQSKGDLCYHIEYGGKEYTEIDHVKLYPYPSIAMIVLDR